MTTFQAPDPFLSELLDTLKNAPLLPPPYSLHVVSGHSGNPRVLADIAKSRRAAYISHYPGLKLGAIPEPGDYSGVHFIMTDGGNNVVAGIRINWAISSADALPCEEAGAKIDELFPEHRGCRIRAELCRGFAQPVFGNLQSLLSRLFYHAKAALVESGADQVVSVATPQTARLDWRHTASLRKSGWQYYNLDAGIMADRDDFIDSEMRFLLLKRTAH